MNRPLLLSVLAPTLLTSTLLFTACTPVQGVKPVLYRASSAEVLAVVTRLCPTLMPNAAYRPFVVRENTPTTVVCFAIPVSTTQTFNTYDPVTLRIDAAASGSTTVSSVTGSQVWGSTAVTNQNALNAVFAALDQSFGRVQ